MARNMVINMMVAAAIFVTPMDASMFLGRQHQSPVIDTISMEARQAFLNELESSLGSEHRSFTERRLTKIEEALRPIYNSVPKNEHGLLGHSAVTFLLHRVFVLRHGWFVRGLDPVDQGAAAFNTSSATAVLDDKVPWNVQEIFEERIGGKGITLQELAVLSATLEHLVHKEAMNRLGVIYDAHSFSSEDVLSSEEAQEVLDTYMSLYILGFVLPGNGSTITPRHVQKLRSSVGKVYPHWPEVQVWVREVKNSTAPERDYLYFADVANVIEAVGDRYGSWQDKECLAIKDELLLSEDSSTSGAGRVRLGDFYKKAIDDGKWQFGESRDYLRQLGALDESDPEDPKVLIANYVNSPSNCVASSSYYSVCCRNECEQLLGHLETQLAKPEATPNEIIALVSSLPSRTTPGDRSLPQWLLRRLDEVAWQHGGYIPLHSRLFMQWMHFAYPRECPYPHVSGTTQYTSVEDVVKGQDVDFFVASQDDMRQQISVPMPNITADADAMWTEEEELIIWRPEETLRTPSRFNGLFFMGSVISVSLMLIRAFQPVLKKVDDAQLGTEKYYV